MSDEQTMCPKCSESEIISETLEFHSFSIDELDSDGGFQVANQMEDRWYVLGQRIACIECDRTYNPATKKLQSRVGYAIYRGLLYLIGRF